MDEAASRVPGKPLLQGTSVAEKILTHELKTCYFHGTLNTEDFP